MANLAKLLHIHCFFCIDKPSRKLIRSQNVQIGLFELLFYSPTGFIFKNRDWGIGIAVCGYIFIYLYMHVHVHACTYIYMHIPVQDQLCCSDQNFTSPKGFLLVSAFPLEKNNTIKSNNFLGWKQASF